MPLKVLIHGCATGVSSSRGVTRKLEEGLAFRVLAAETGLATFGKQSIDGTKVRANASKRKATSCGRMQEERRLEAEIESLLDRARATDQTEDARLRRFG